MDEISFGNIHFFNFNDYGKLELFHIPKQFQGILPTYMLAYFDTHNSFFLMYIFKIYSI